MSAIKFNHVFALLMLISALCAFVIPEKYVARVQPQVQSLFMPVATPVRAVAGWAYQRLARPEKKDDRDVRTLSVENDALRQQNVALQHALDVLRRVNADRANLGTELLPACTAVPVVGPDPGGRQSLLLRGSSLDGLREGMFVLHPGGIAGLISRPPGLMGAQVRLVTDPGVRVTVYFRKYAGSVSTTKPSPDRLPTPPAVVEGTGDGAMRCVGLTMKEVEQAKLARGDLVLLEDKDWDERVHGREIGRVTSIQPQIAAPLYAEIRVEPTRNLLMLRDVMVLTK